MLPAVCILVLLTALRGEASMLPMGAELQDMRLGSSAPVIIETYLGVESRDRFMLSQVRARAIIINVYSLYCPPCHREAPRLNELYDMLQKQGLSDSVKIIGVAAGNSETEVDAFRTRHQVPYPLFADQDYELHKKLGETVVPTVYVLALEDGKARVIHAQDQAVDNAEAFLERIRMLTDL